MYIYPVSYRLFCYSNTSIAVNILNIINHDHEAAILPVLAVAAGTRLLHTSQIARAH